MFKDIDEDLKLLIKKFLMEIYSCEIPESVQVLAEENPAFLKKWFELRNIARYEGVLPLKTKHLIWLTAQALRTNRDGCLVHVKGALEAGADKKEIMETALILYVTAGGTAGALILDVLKKVLGSFEI